MFHFLTIFADPELCPCLTWNYVPADPGVWLFASSPRGDGNESQIDAFREEGDYTHPREGTETVNDAL